MRICTQALLVTEIKTYSSLVLVDASNLQIFYVKLRYRVTNGVFKIHAIMRIV